jgi:hypothetical protein
MSDLLLGSGEWLDYQQFRFVDKQPGHEFSVSQAE